MSRLDASIIFEALSMGCVRCVSHTVAVLFRFLKWLTTTHSHLSFFFALQHNCVPFHPQHVRMDGGYVWHKGPARYLGPQAGVNGGTLACVAPFTTSRS
jgi:hypothetical protein